MSLLANTVNSASAQISFKYFDTDEVFGYSISATYSVEITEVTYTTEDGELLEGRLALETALETQKITARIGADEFTNAKLSNVSFGESPLVGSATASFTLEQGVMVDDYSNTTFAKYIPNPHLISSFSEDFSFARNGGEYTFSRTVSLQYDLDAGGEFLSLASKFLSNFYHRSRPNFGYYEDGISEEARFDEADLHKTISEEIDLIGLSVSMTENFNSSFIEGPYSRKELTKINVSPEGFLLKDVSVTLKANKEPLEFVVAEAVKTVTDDLASNNAAQFGEPMSIQKGINKDGGEATLSVSFSTDPRHQGTNFVEYNVRKTKNGGFFNYEMALSFMANGVNQEDRKSNIQDLWLSEQTTYTTKVSNLFTEADPIFEVSRSSVFDSERPKMTETVVFTDDPSFDTESLEDGVLYLKVQNSKDIPVPRTQKIFDLGDLKSKLAEKPNLLSLGRGTLTLSMGQEAGRDKFFGRDFLTGMDTGLSGIIGETGFYVNSDQIQIDLSNGSTQRVIGYEYI